MVKIRLTRAGARNRPFYRIVAVDERRPRDGRPLEFLGTFDPKVNPEKLSAPKPTSRGLGEEGRAALADGEVARAAREAAGAPPRGETPDGDRAAPRS